MLEGEITPAEQADRSAIRELMDDYAHCADRREAERQKSLFNGDTFVKVDGAWLVAERNLCVDWIETRTPHP